MTEGRQRQREEERERRKEGRTCRKEMEYHEGLYAHIANDAITGNTNLFIIFQAM